MDCPRCNFNIQKDEKRCLKCGMNITGFKKCIYISNKLYNQGLNLANKGEFSNAIEILKKSILYNKTNTDARNLLGLLYYKIGHFADAMKQWVISSNYNTLDENIAFKYIEKIRKNMRQFEKYNDAVRLYNQAIKYLKKKNDDLAIIRLRNALKIYPDFVDAMNLLTFCYIIKSNNKKALAIVKNTLEIDINNKKAAFYLIKLTSTNEENILDKKYISNGNIVLYNDDEVGYKAKNKFKISINFIMLIFGLIISYLVMYFLYIPDYKEKNDKIITENKNAYEILKEEISNENEQLKTENEQLQIEKEQLQIEKEQLQKQIEDYKNNLLKQNRAKLEQVSNFIKDNKKREAKVIFETIDTSNFSEEDIKNYEKLKENF